MSNNYRFDNRSKDEFKTDIKRATKIENWLIDLWVREMTLRGHDVKYFDNGVDNSGEFVDNPNSSSDYKIKFNGKTEFVEVKTSPIGNDKKSSFKVDSLKACLRNHASMLVFYNIATRSNEFIKDTDLYNVYWYKIDQFTQRHLLDIYKPQSIKHIMGGKQIIVVPHYDYGVFGSPDRFSYLLKE